MTYVQLVTPNLNVTYKGGWCQKASENSVGQSGVYASAYKAWLGNVQHTDAPPKGLYVPIYLNMPNGPKDPQGIQEDDVAWSCPDGSVAAAAQSGTHTGLFKYPSLQAYVNDYAKWNGGATYRGWGEYVGRLQVVKQGGTEDMDDEGAKELYRLGLHREPEDDKVWRGWVGKKPEDAMKAFRGSTEFMTQNHILKVAYPALLEQVKALQVSSADKAKIDKLMADIDAAQEEFNKS